MPTLTRTSTTEMEVTSIRLDRDLKEHLKTLSGNQGYQALIRDILWNYVHQRSGDSTLQLSPTDIRATIAATAQRDERCTITGGLIRSGEEMLLGFTIEGNLIPLALGSLG
ncbi:BrnA antitoxin family protein [Myxacorys almedinensis]|uniref:Uncharacterized protein n=1 Tax=Myxacorys almedinensis A TaxID=2690445 RepID=A0A8J7YZ99_9CYAN|nr:BrnA antitoxin family protein [Myxacorys almedinensis]NDJ16105.1 hypothetical protein [Myxacorys almedinensis A]